MLIAARNSFMVGGKLTAKSYIQDGLIAMWDGIENAGWGVHDPNATVWKDLSGNGYDSDNGYTDASHLVWGDDYLDINQKCLMFTVPPLYNCLTSETLWVELVMKEVASASNRPALFAAGPNVQSLSGDTLLYYFVGATSGYICWNGTYRISVTGSLSQSLLTFACSPDRVYYYKNGELKSNMAAEGSTTPYQTFRIGGAGNESNGRLVAKYNAIRMYSRLPTAAEIAHNYAVDKARLGLT